MMDPNDWSEKRTAVFHMLSLLGGQVSIKGFRDYFQFSSTYNSHEYYLTIEQGKPVVIGNAYYIHPHNRDQNWAGEKRIDLPEETVESVYKELRQRLVNAFQDQIETEKRDRENRSKLMGLLHKYGIPEEYDGT